MEQLRAAGFLVLAGLTSAFFGCGGGNGGASPTATAPLEATASPSPPAVAPSGDPGVTVENAVQACREKNVDLLRAFVAGAVSEADADALFARGDDVRLALRQQSVFDGDRASVEVSLEIQRNGATEKVARSWNLERSADGVWRFLELPDCF